jgi:uncharacterized repeat protein (TIGR02543 family)
VPKQAKKPIQPPPTSKEDTSPSPADVSPETSTVTTVTVTYLVDESVFAIAAPALNTYLIEPDPPIKTGYDFIGWNRDGENTFWDFEVDQISFETTLTAAFEKIEKPEPKPKMSKPKKQSNKSKRMKKKKRTPVIIEEG